MTRKSLGVVIVMLAFCTGLMAQDHPMAPWLGVWELDLDRTTTYGDMTFQMYTNLPEPGGGYTSHRAMIHEGDRSNTEIHRYHSFDDGVSHRNSGSDIRDFLYTLIDPLTVERNYERNGEKFVDVETVSADGKTMMIEQPQRNRVRYYNKVSEYQPVR